MWFNETHIHRIINYKREKKNFTLYNMKETLSFAINIYLFHRKHMICFRHFSKLLLHSTFCKKKLRRLQHIFICFTEKT